MVPVASGEQKGFVDSFRWGNILLVEGKPHAQEWGRMVEKDGFLWVICVV